MNTIVNITHVDLDGVGNTIVLKALYPEAKVKSYFCTYHDVEQTINYVLDNLTDEISNIYITDISFRKESGIAERIEELNKKRGSNFIRLFDHHVTSGYLNHYSWASSHEKDPVTKELKCGTQWLYDTLMYENSTIIRNEVLDYFVELVNMWDTWRWVTDFPKDKPYEQASWLNTILSTYGKKKFIDEYVKKIIHYLPIFDDVETAIIENNIRSIESSIAKKDKEMIVTPIQYRTRRRNLNFIKEYMKSYKAEDKNYLLDVNYKKSFKVGVIFLERNISIVASKLAEMHPELDFIMCIGLPEVLSLRCVKDLDVPLGIMAKFLAGNGGGHPKSAGATLKQDASISVIESILKLD